VVGSWTVYGQMTRGGIALPSTRRRRLLGFVGACRVVARSFGADLLASAASAVGARYPTASSLPRGTVCWSMWQSGPARRQR
jgi:hypothetical protein